MKKNKKKLIKVAIATLATTLTLSGCSSDENKDKPKVTFVKNHIINIDEVNDANGSLIELIKLIDDQSLSATLVNSKDNIFEMGSYKVKVPKLKRKIGKQKVIFTLNNKYKYPITIRVKDTKKPRIISFVDKITITEGDNFKIKNIDYDVLDNYSKSENINTKVVSNFKNKAGFYSAFIEAKDEAGNYAKKEIVIEVKEKMKEPEPIKEVPKIENKSNTPNKVNISNKESVTNKPQQSQPKPQPRPVQPQISRPTSNASAQTRIFRIRDYGYSIASCERAAKEYGRSVMNAGGANGYQCLPASENGQIVGYRVVFN